MSKILVTGGSKGLGRAIVEECLSLGASVLFTARGREELDRVQATLAAVYGAERVQTMAADVSTADGRAALVAPAAESSAAPWRGCRPDPPKPAV